MQFQVAKNVRAGKGKVLTVAQYFDFSGSFQIYEKKFHPKCYQAGLPLVFLTCYVEFVSFVSHCLSGMPVNSG